MIRAHVTKHFPGNHPRTVAVREYLIEVCERFVGSGLADPKFVSELASGDEQKFWSCISEAFIYQRLTGKQFGKRDGIGKGPDFLVVEGGQRIWIEVVCPQPVGLPGDWLNPGSGTVVNFPHEKILLRWTSAIKAKAEVLLGSPDGTKKGYLQLGVVGQADVYVIAVNGSRLRSGPWPALTGISQLPFAAEAVFPIGPIELRIDRQTMEVVDRGHQHRPHVLNRNRARVPAVTFLDPRFESISAIWAVDLNGGSAIGNTEPTAVIHNPNARNPLPIGFLPADDEYLAHQEGDEYVLQKVAV